MDEGSLPKILLVDDDVAALARLRDHFTRRGFAVLTATNGVDACRQARRWAPHAVIMDLFIPRLGGIAALRRMRAMAPHLPIVFTSETGDALAMIADVGVRVSGAFSKPLDPDCLVGALARAGVVPAARVAGPPPSSGWSRIDTHGRIRLAPVENRAVCSLA